MATDTSEKGLEALIVQHMTGTDGLAVPPTDMARPPIPYGGTGYIAGSPYDYADLPRDLRAIRYFRTAPWLMNWCFCLNSAGVR